MGEEYPPDFDPAELHRRDMARLNLEPLLRGIVAQRADHIRVLAMEISKPLTTEPGADGISMIIACIGVAMFCAEQMSDVTTAPPAETILRDVFEVVLKLHSERQKTGAAAAMSEVDAILKGGRRG